MSLEQVITEQEKIDNSFLKWLSGTPYSILHPNRISALGAFSTIAGTLMLSSPTLAPLGIFFIANGDITADMTDGKLARKYKQTTIEGSKLDPLMDKVKHSFVGGYIAFNNPEEILLNGIYASSIGLDLISQKVGRGNLSSQIKEAAYAIMHPQNCTLDTQEKSSSRAAMAGKIKTGIQTGVHITYALNQTASHYYTDQISEYIKYSDIDKGLTYLMTSALAISLGFASKGIWDRYSALKQIPTNQS